MALSNQEIVDALKEKSLLETSELVKMIEETFGVSAAAAVAAAPAAGAALAKLRRRLKKRLSSTSFFRLRAAIKLTSSRSFAK